MNYKISAGLVLRYINGRFVTEQTDLYVKDGKIFHIGRLSSDDGYEMVDAKDKLIMPGLINMHTHAYMSVMKCFADDVDFGEWLFKRIMPVEDRLDGEAAYWGSMLGCAEMIRSGTTCFVDMHLFEGNSARAAGDSGMRAVIGRGLVGEDLYGDGKERLAQALGEMRDYQSDKIRFVLSPHAIYTCSEKLLRQVVEESEKRGMLRQTHLSESDTEIKDCLAARGKTPVEYLRDIGFLSDKAILAHCVKMQGDDISILAESGAHIVTNPASNAKLGNGFAPITEMRKAGVRICLGTDSAASNNTLNMFREMNLLTLIHKGLAGDSTAAEANFVLQTATVNGARALGMENEIGQIREGASADLVFVDLTSSSLFPNHDIASSLCYAAGGSEVESVMIAGKFVMKNREMLTIDEERVRFENRQTIKKYF